MHTVAPDSAATFPAGHSMQADKPSLPLYVPARHDVQKVEFRPPATLPAGHFVHLVVESIGKTLESIIVASIVSVYSPD